MKFEVWMGTYLLYEEGKVFHGEDKEEGWEGISLSEAPSPFKSPMDLPIEVDNKSHCGDVSHYPCNKDLGEFQSYGKLFQKAPMDGVKSFLEFDFHNASRGYGFPLVSPSQVMAYKDII